MPDTHLTLSIDSGNATMLTVQDIASALRNVADTIDGYAPKATFGGPIMDSNGNQVGHYHGNGSWGEESND